MNCPISKDKIENYYTLQFFVLIERQTSWRTFKSNVEDVMPFNRFLQKINECTTKRQIKQLAFQYV